MKLSKKSLALFAIFTASALVSVTPAESHSVKRSRIYVSPRVRGYNVDATSKNWTGSNFSENSAMWRAANGFCKYQGYEEAVGFNYSKSAGNEKRIRFDRTGDYTYFTGEWEMRAITCADY